MRNQQVILPHRTISLEWVTKRPGFGSYRAQLTRGRESGPSCGTLIEIIIVNFTDRQLRECYERNFSEMTGCSGAVRQVNALIATHDFFQMLEGSHSSRVHETMEALLSPELRPGLRDRYRLFNADLNAADLAFRDQLNVLAGEKLEREENLPDNPS